MKIPASVAAAASAVEDKPRTPKTRELLVDGRYDAKLIEIKAGETSNKNLKATLKFELQGEHAGRWVYRDLIFTEKAAGIVKSVVVDGLGLSLEADLNDAIGRSVSLVIGQRSYTDSQGELKTVNEVKFVNAGRTADLHTVDGTPATPVAPLF